MAAPPLFLRTGCAFPSLAKSDKDFEIQDQKDILTTMLYS